MSSIADEQLVPRYRADANAVRVDESEISSLLEAVTRAEEPAEKRLVEGMLAHVLDLVGPGEPRDVLARVEVANEAMASVVRDYRGDPVGFISTVDAAVNASIA